MGRSRATAKKRGAETAKIAAGWFAQWWPRAEATAAGIPGPDIRHMPGIDVEVKGSSRFEPLAWLKQMRDRAVTEFEVDLLGDAPGLPNVYIGVWRPDGYGAASAGNWPVITDVRTVTRLLVQAGYAPGSGSGGEADGGP